MHEPGARVVRWEGDNDPAAAGEEGHVSAVWVVECEGRCLGAGVEDAAAASKDVKVVAVEMDWMGNWDGSSGTAGLLDNPIGPLDIALVVLTKWEEARNLRSGPWGFQ